MYFICFWGSEGLVGLLGFVCLFSCQDVHQDLIILIQQKSNIPCCSKTEPSASDFHHVPT